MRLYFLVLFFISGTSTLLACDCDERPTFEAGFKNSDVIFSAEVISIRPHNVVKTSNVETYSELIVEFKITAMYKGKAAKRIEVITAVAVVTCGYPFEEGKRYLVYGNSENGGINVSYCSRTSEIGSAKDDIKKLKLAAKRHWQKTTAPVSHP